MGVDDFMFYKLFIPITFSLTVSDRQTQRMRVYVCLSIFAKKSNEGL